MRNIGLKRDLPLPLLLLPALLLKNLINGGGNFSALLGLDIGFDKPFIFSLFLLPLSLSLYTYTPRCICNQEIPVGLPFLFLGVFLSCTFYLRFGVGGGGGVSVGCVFYLFINLSF